MPKDPDRIAGLIVTQRIGILSKHANLPRISKDFDHSARRQSELEFLGIRS
jgi:hypothetical protein